MTMRRVKTGDTVVVTTGKSKGVKGKVLRVLKSERLIVEGANLIKKHVKPNPQKNEKGGILERESSVHVSNVALALPAQKGKNAKLFSKVGVKAVKGGKKSRYFKVNGELIDVK
jgi:large subunit ribosomal protein L24